MSTVNVIVVCVNPILKKCSYASFGIYTRLHQKDIKSVLAGLVHTCKFVFEQAGSSPCVMKTVTELVSQNLTEICQWKWSGVAQVAVVTSLPCRFNVFALCVNPWRVDT